MLCCYLDGVLRTRRPIQHLWRGLKRPEGDPIRSWGRCINSSRHASSPIPPLVISLMSCIGRDMECWRIHSAAWSGYSPRVRYLAPDQFSILMFVLLKRVPRWRVVPSPESNDNKQGNRAGLFTRKVESSSSSSWGGDKIALHKPVPRRVVPTRNGAPRRPVTSASAYGRQSPADAKSGVGLLSPAPALPQSASQR